MSQPNINYIQNNNNNSYNTRSTSNSNRNNTNYNNENTLSPPKNYNNDIPRPPPSSPPHNSHNYKMTRSSAFSIMELSNNASRREIICQYRILSRLYHPDK